MRFFSIFIPSAAKGSRFTFGDLGVEKRSLDVAFAFATVRNRPQHDRKWYPMAVPIATAVKVIIVSNIAYPRFVWQAWNLELRDIATCFIARRKSFCVTG